MTVMQTNDIFASTGDLYNPLTPGANAVMLGSPGTASLATGAVLKEGYLYKVRAPSRVALACPGGSAAHAPREPKRVTHPASVAAHDPVVGPPLLCRPGVAPALLHARQGERRLARAQRALC